MDGARMRGFVFGVLLGIFGAAFCILTYKASPSGVPTSAHYASTAEEYLQGLSDECSLWGGYMKISDYRLAPRGEAQEGYEIYCWKRSPVVELYRFNITSDL